MDEIVKFVEPIFNFCVRRLNSRHDAEDLASEIMVHILSGVKKYEIESLEKWVWRIAHNRYARFIDKRNKRNEVPHEYDTVQDDYDFVDALVITDEYSQVFKFLHTLSSEYRNIMVDYYIGSLPIKEIAKNYGLSQATVKWRLNISRQKIKARIGENKMDKVYKRINWNTGTCNGNIDSDQYLHSQIARAICEAAYEKPLTVEEISIKTGLPTMYIEDELPRLIYGDAIVKEGNKYATNFIVLRLCDKKVMVTKFAPIVDKVADYFANAFEQHAASVAKMDFYGSDFGMARLGYIALSGVIRDKTENVMTEDLGLQRAPFPPRLDGGYGWFIVDEKETQDESTFTTESGRNSYSGKNHFINYYWVGRYLRRDVCDSIDMVAGKNLIDKTEDGIFPSSAISEDDLARLAQGHLVVKDGDKYKLNFAMFTLEQFYSFRNLFGQGSDSLDKLLGELISDIHKSFKAFVPKRLDSQINQYVCCYIHNIIGFVAEELIAQGVLEKPDDTKPMTNGVFSVLGEHVNV